MTIHLPEQQVSVFTVPKCMSTSLKNMFFEFENGIAADTLRINGRMFSLQGLYKTGPFAQTRRPINRRTWNITVVRDPLSRIVSVYRNRVMHGRVIERRGFRSEDLGKGLSTMPELDEFVANLRRYRKASVPVAHHTHPLSYYLGDDPGFYSRIYSIREVDALMADLTERLGELPPLERHMAEGPDIGPDALSEASRARLEEMYEEDFRIYGKFFGNMVPT